MPLPRPSVVTLARFAEALACLGFSSFAAPAPSASGAGCAGASAFGASSAFTSSSFNSGVHVALIEPSFGSIASARSLAIGFGVAPFAVTVKLPAASTGASGIIVTGVPPTNMPSNFVSASSGSPAAMTMFASLPASIVPMRASTPSCRAGTVVSAASASSLVRPCAIASASFLRNAPLSCMRCVVSETSLPFATKRFGFVGA